MTNAAIPNGRGWYPDPYSKGESLRLFDGARWTDQTRPIPEGYDASHAEDSSAQSKKPDAADQAAPRANPTNAPALEGSSKPAPKKPKAAKNGTAPMFSTPTEKAATKPSNQSNPAEQPDVSKPDPEAKPAKAPKPPQAGPAFASPTVTAERPNDDTPAPAAKAPETPAPPAPDPAPKPAPAPTEFSFAKPVTEDPAPAQPEPSSVPSQEPESRPRSTTPGPGSVDDNPDEDSESVNNAFAAAPTAAAFSDEAVDAEDSSSSTSRRGARSREALQGAMRNVKAVTWVLTTLTAVTVVLLAVFVPSPIRSVASECEPISNVIASYDGADDFAVSPEAQGQLASAVSTGAVSEEIADMATTAVEEDNLEPLVERCLPQES